MLRGSERIGPSGPEELREAGLAPDSLVWKAGMADWVRADTLPELAPLCARPSRGTGPHEHGYEKETFERGTLTLPALCMGVAVPAVFVAALADDARADALGLPAIAAIFLLLGSAGFFLARYGTLVYRCWNLLSAEGRFLSPSTATVLALVPFVDLVGNFYAIQGLAKAMEAVLLDYGREPPRMAGRAGAYCILRLVSMGCSLAAPVAFVCLVVLSRDLARAASEIVACQREAEGTPAGGAV
jgi:hypothetical protein